MTGRCPWRTGKASTTPSAGPCTTGCLHYIYSPGSSCSAANNTASPLTTNTHTKHQKQTRNATTAWFLIFSRCEPARYGGPWRPYSPEPQGSAPTGVLFTHTTWMRSTDDGRWDGRGRFSRTETIRGSGLGVVVWFGTFQGSRGSRGGRSMKRWYFDFREHGFAQYTLVDSECSRW